MAVLSVPTAGVLLIAFTDFGLNFFWRVFFYAAFLLLVTLTGLHQFFYSYLEVFRRAAEAGKAGDLGVWTFPLAGMVFCQLAVYAVYVMKFIPKAGGSAGEGRPGSAAAGQGLTPPPI